MAEDWRLRDEQGTVRSLTTHELRDGLSRGVIPSSALVQRAGGKDFAPAFSVPELATAAIRAKRMPSIPPGGPPSAPRAGAARAGAEASSAPRSRRRIAHTLVGIQGDEDDGPASASLGAPIIAPGAGGTLQGAPRAITQVPRYTPSPPMPSPSGDDVVIPRAPRAPGSTTLTVTDQGWEDPGQAMGASIFDGEEDAQTLVQKSEPPRRMPPKAPAKPGPPGPPPKHGDPSRRPHSQPPPVPPRREGGASAPPGRPPMRHTVMGLGAGGVRVPPRAPSKGSTPPPPPARPVSKPPPAPPLKRTPAPPPVAARRIVDEPTLPTVSAIVDEKTDVTPAPAAVQAATTASSPKPPAATSSPKQTATSGVKPPATMSLATASAATHETLMGGIAAPAPPTSAAATPRPAAGAPGMPAPTFEGTPTVPMPEAREGAPTFEGTPTVPMPEAREGASDGDDAPTSKMAVQIVHGAAMAMRAALAAPHFDKPVSGAPIPEAVPPVSALPAVSELPSAVAVAPAPTSAAALPATTAVAVPLVSDTRGGATALGQVQRESSQDLKPSLTAASTGVTAAASLDNASPIPSEASVRLPRPPRTPRESDASPRPTRPGLMGSTPPPAAHEEDDEEAAPQSGVEVPVSSLLAASGVWIAGLVLVFFVGRCSAIEARPPAARSAVGTAAKLAFLRAAPGSRSGATELRACNVSRRPTRWAPAASKNIPFDMAALPGGAAIMVGYGGPEDKVGVGVRIDPRTAKFDQVFNDKLDDGVSRVTPLPGAAADAPTKFFLTPRGDTTLVAVPSTQPPLWVRFGASGIETLTAPDAEGAKAFGFDGDDRPNSEQVLPTSAGVFLAFRRGEGILGGWVDASGKPKGELAAVVGSGGKVGKPHTGWNGKEVAVTFADKPDGSPWQIRIGHATGGAVPTTTAVFDVPAGGPGGDAIAPDIVGLEGGRWLLMWTEGAAGNRAIQSITLGPDFAPIGDAIALSPPSGNFGQAQLGVVGRYVTVLFLQKGDEDFELWGAVLQCG